MVRAGGNFFAKTVELAQTDRNPPTTHDGRALVAIVEGQIFEIPDARGLDLMTPKATDRSPTPPRRLHRTRFLEYTAWVYYIMSDMDGEVREGFRSKGNLRALKFSVSVEAIRMNNSERLLNRGTYFPFRPVRLPTTNHSSKNCRCDFYIK